MSKILEKLKPAELHWDENGQPFSLQFNDVYFSRASGLQETQYVFLDANNLKQRFANLKPKQHFVIGETGFGTGLNFLAAWQYFIQHAPPSTQLYFISTELQPLRKTDLKQALQLWPELESQSTELLKHYPALVPGSHYRKLAQGRVHLQLLFGDATEGFKNMLDSDHPEVSHTKNRRVDAWFLDGFAPAKNPDMWIQPLLKTIGKLSGPNTTASSFTAAGDVRRALAAAGFQVTKVPGFGTKREMITAVFHSMDQPIEAADALSTDTPDRTKNDPRFSAYDTPWQLSSASHSCSNEVVIIGSGIAACTSARALAEKGVQVTVVEKNATISSEASGNPQAVLYSKLSSNDGFLSRFVLASLPYALGYYSALQARSDTHFFEQCGVLQLTHNQKMEQTHDSLKTFFHDIDHSLLEFLDTKQASILAGIPVNYPALFIPDAGWVNPEKLALTLLDHPLIQLETHYEVKSIEQSGNRWRLLTDSKQASKPAIETGCLVIACGSQSTNFQQTSSTPLKPVRGQVSFLPSGKYSEQLKTVICGDGYIAPVSMLNNFHSLGATYNLGDTDTCLNERDHLQNLETLSKVDAKLAATFAAEAKSSDHAINGRVGFRATTPDYLPICGPVPDEVQMHETYKHLSHNAKASIPRRAPCLPGLFINTGYGSRGFTYAPLCAEVLCAHILGYPFPLQRDLIKALSPSRFAIRQLQKKRLSPSYEPDIKAR